MLSWFIRMAALCVVASSHTNGQCKLYLAPSKIPDAGKGVFSGVKAKQEDYLESTPNVIVRTDHIRSLQLFNYVYSAEDDDFSMASFGASMLYNHKNPKDIDHYWASGDIPPAKSVLWNPYTTYTQSNYELLRNIEIGEEIFTSYGEEEWFSSRNIPFSPAPKLSYKKYTLPELDEAGHCLDNVYVNDSSIPLAGKGLFSRRSFKKGDIVHVSPLVILPKHSILLTTKDSVLMNYCLEFSPSSDVLLLPISLTGMLNNGLEKYSNLAVEWYTWRDDGVDFLRKSILELEKLPFASLYVKYTALTDIPSDTELLIPYGSSWQIAWLKYLDELSTWSLESSQLEDRPQFRHPLLAPKEMQTDDIMQATCIGSTPCKQNALLDTNNEVRRKLISIEESKKYFSSNSHSNVDL